LNVSTPTNSYEVEQIGAVTSLYFDISTGWKQWILLQSDNHRDSIYANGELDLQHLNKAKSRDALIFILGDFVDAMQGRFDPRRSMAELQERYRREDYYDFLVNDAIDFYKPFAHNLVMIADGNHELAVLKYSNTNIPDRVAAGLRATTGSRTLHGGYGGWVRFMFNLSGGKNTGPRTSIKMKYFHGSGGEAPVTRGAIHTNRQAVFLPDADIVVNGHNHHSYYIPISRERLGNKGAIYFDIQHHIRIPGYKQSYGDGTTGWDVTKGGVPKPIGCAWCLFSLETKEGKQYIDIKVISDVQGANPVSVSSNDLYDGRIYDDDNEGE